MDGRVGPAQPISGVHGARRCVGLEQADVGCNRSRRCARAPSSLLAGCFGPARTGCQQPPLQFCWNAMPNTTMVGGASNSAHEFLQPGPDEAGRPAGTDCLSLSAVKNRARVYAETGVAGGSPASGPYKASAPTERSDFSSIMRLKTSRSI